MRAVSAILSLLFVTIAILLIVGVIGAENKMTWAIIFVTLSFIFRYAKFEKSESAQ